VKSFVKERRKREEKCGKWILIQTSGGKLEMWAKHY